MNLYRIAYREACYGSTTQHSELVEHLFREADTPELALIAAVQDEDWPCLDRHALVVNVVDVTSWTPLNFAKDAIARHDAADKSGVSSACGCGPESECEGASKILRGLVEWLEKQS